MLKLIRSILLLPLIIYSSTVWSSDYRFSHITTANGISQSEVYAFCEDSDGFMWFGTVDGLNRYDGYSIEIFNIDRENEHSLSNNTIRSLVEDQMGRLWIGTDDGLNYYDQEKELINKVRIKTYKEKFSVWSMLVLDDYILIGTNDGLWRAPVSCTTPEEFEKNFERLSKAGRVQNENGIYRAIKTSIHGGIWVLTDNSVSRIIFQPNKKEPIIIEELNLNKIGNLITMEEDPSGSIWIVSSVDGIIRYNPARKHYQYITHENEFLNNNSKKYWDIAFDHDQNIWIGTIDNGLIFINYDYSQEMIREVESIQNDPENLKGLNSNLIFSLYVSTSNKLWVGTIGSGINIYDPEFKKFQYYKIISDDREMTNSNFIRSVLVDDDNRIWAGTHNDGLYLIDRETRKSRKLGFGAEPVFYIEQYANDQYFICTGDGVSLVEMKGDSFSIIDKCEEIIMPVFFIKHSRNNVFWCATLNGLVRLRVIGNTIVKDAMYNKTSQPSISANNCRVLFYDNAKNQLIVGTEGGGLNYVFLDDECKPLKIEVYQKSDDTSSLSNNYVRSIFQDQYKNTWIGTYEGLNKVVHDSVSGALQFKVYTVRDGLPNNMIECLVEDSQNTLWIGTNGGLSRFSPSDETFVNYNMDDGLQSNEFSEHTVFKTDEGEVFMGGINGINAFAPEGIKVSQSKPTITITDFFLNNERIKPGQNIGKRLPLKRSLLKTDTLLLAPRFKNIGFKFTALMYPNASKVEYAYMLEGFDENWNYVDAQNRNAIYTNLRHGKYVFKVKATNTDGVWDDTADEMYIHLKTPFVNTWYAYLLYSLAIVLIFVYFSHFTIIRYTTKKNLLLEKEHNERLHNLDELRTKFFINISHDLRTPLTLISGPLEKILKDRSISVDIKENLQLIKRNVKRLNYLVEQLLDVRKAESGKLTPKLQVVDMLSFAKEELSHFTYAVNKKGLELTLESPHAELPVQVDPGMLSKVFFNIISNAIKYTDSGFIKVHLEKVDQQQYPLLKAKEQASFVKVEISDTGTGISKEKLKFIFERFYQDNQQNTHGYGIGLSHTKELIEVHKGLIEAEAAENAGTIIRFFIPVDEEAPNTQKEKQSSSEDIYIHSDIDNEKEIMEDSEPVSAKTVLVVEDNADMLHYIKNGLNENYRVLLAADGAEGLSIARAKMPDMIVSDVMMPKMDGIAFCRELKTNIKTSHIPLILLTAKVDSNTKYEGIETGADDYISKPFEMDYLLLRINNLLQSRENLRKLFQKNTILEPSAVTVTSVDEQFLAALIKAIEENMADENFSITSLESEMGMSHSSFYRKIKSLTGQSGQEILLDMRMKRAHQILSEKKGLRISEVAYMVGFNNPKYFSKCFKELFGYAPSEINS